MVTADRAILCLFSCALKLSLSDEFIVIKLLILNILLITDNILYIIIVAASRTKQLITKT